MNQLLLSLLIPVLLLMGSWSQQKESSDLERVLLDQLYNTHTNQEWFVPTKVAIAGLSAEQSNWKDSTGNHSIGELVSHLAYWGEMNLRSFRGEDMSGLDTDNETTFRAYSDEEWDRLVSKLDSIQTQWELETANANDEKLAEWSTEIANMAAHNAYHTGQIIYIRKLKGWWK